jgi:hypothetical protein
MSKKNILRGGITSTSRLRHPLFARNRFHLIPCKEHLPENPGNSPIPEQACSLKGAVCSRAEAMYNLAVG